MYSDKKSATFRRKIVLFSASFSALWSSILITSSVYLDDADIPPSHPNTDIKTPTADLRFPIASSPRIDFSNLVVSNAFAACLICSLIVSFNNFLNSMSRVVRPVFLCSWTMHVFSPFTNLTYFFILPFVSASLQFLR